MPESTKGMEQIPRNTLIFLPTILHKSKNKWNQCPCDFLVKFVSVAINRPDSLKIKASFLNSVKSPELSFFYTDAPGC